MGAARGLGEFVQGTCRKREIGKHPDDRLHARQSAPLGSGWKRGEQKQAIGRSRGGRNTKVHARADARGRLLAILLTGGEAHDCPVAERLIATGKASKRRIGDKAYDSAELRQWLKSAGRGAKPAAAALAAASSELVSLAPTSSRFWAASASPAAATIANQV
ncbi:MAG: hypothetical protein CR217_00675 [Beijerinckiaceae bacterium]|nr:MAG: hypothetical protein CR217_00675 [Beijerinckiaceae bacterium]